MRQCSIRNEMTRREERTIRTTADIPNNRLQTNVLNTEAYRKVFFSLGCSFRSIFVLIGNRWGFGRRLFVRMPYVWARVYWPQELST